MGYHRIQPDPSLAGLQAFRQARRRADLHKLWARLTGQSNELLCFYEVQDLLLREASFAVSRKQIPLERIVGSVERCTDYTLDFLPLKDSDEGRWTSMKRAFASAKTVPPIRVYRVGDIYFVVDGNHRVSVARQLGWTHLEAHVVHIQARIPFSIDDAPAELNLKRRYALFLEATRLHEVRPQADLWLPVPARYEALQTEIEAHRRFLATAGRREVPIEEAAADWYDRVYLPAVEAIRRASSPDASGRTEASLYLALRAHRAALEEALGREVPLELAVEDLVLQLDQPPAPVCPLTRLWREWLAPWKS